MTKSKQVLCCGVDRWTKIISWFQIILSSICVLILCLSMVLLFTVEENQIANFIQESQHPALLPYKHFGLVILLVILLCLIVIALLTLFMGTILLKGVKKRNLKCLRIWLVYSMLCVVIDAIGSFVTLDISSIWGVLGGLLIILLRTSITIFLIWIVYTFKNELKIEALARIARKTVH